MTLIELTKHVAQLYFGNIAYVIYEEHTDFDTGSVQPFIVIQIKKEYDLTVTDLYDRFETDWWLHMMPTDHSLALELVFL